MSEPSFPGRVLIKIFKGVNKVVAWHKFPSFIGVFNLLAFRLELQRDNLHDTYPDAGPQGTTASCPMKDPRYLVTRNSDGLFNELDEPKMGCANMRFGRNVSREHTKKPSDDELLTPNPRVVSEQLLKRTVFKPATIVNLLAAAWIQFQLHDWVMHEEYDYKSEKDNEVIRFDAENWPPPSGNMKMKIARTKPDDPKSKLDESCPAYKNTNTAWWDASQMYGSNEETTMMLRQGAELGKLKMRKEGHIEYLPRDENNLPQTGFNQNWWLGLELLHTLFAKEHNSICDMLLKKHPDFSSDQLFDTARIINCALMAKIHTVEWTPAILDHPTIDKGLHANWWGLLGEKLDKLLGHISKNELICGIPGSGVDQNNVPYSLTEEFVSVYRLHPLIPDKVAFFDRNTGSHIKTKDMIDLAFSSAQYAIDKTTTFGDAFYSFGINYPGAITHHNYPDFLRHVKTPDDQIRDLATVDILRDRERGVPRYCEFRRLFHMKSPTTFLELTGGNKELADEISSVYAGDLEKVDLLVGMFSEPLPKGFGFSDTAFRVFILMASRRIKSDRFLAGDAWGEHAYTKEGLKWVQNETMSSVLIRHFPDLAPALKGKDNAFRPWVKVGKAAEYKGVETNA